MTKDQKIIRAKAGLLELAKQLGNVSQACKIMGYSRDSFYRFQIVMLLKLHGARQLGKMFGETEQVEFHRHGRISCWPLAHASSRRVLNRLNWQ